MKLLVIGAGMMGSAAAYDMARSQNVEAVTLADSNITRAKDAARRMNKLSRTKKIRPVKLDAEKARPVTKLMAEHDAALSCVPYFLNPGLAKAAVAARCHFADLGGNNRVVRQEYDLARKAIKRQVLIAPDCGLSPGMASILGGELLHRLRGTADAIKVYVGGLPLKPRPPFQYQLVFSAEGLINEYVEPCRILRKHKVTEIEPLTEPEMFIINGFPPLEAFHTSGGTSTMPETFEGKVGMCFEKTLRYQGHYAIIRALYDLGLFSKEEVKLGKSKIVPRQLMTRLFTEKFAGDDPDIVILRVEAHRKGYVSALTVVDHYDESTEMTAMMRCTAWPASIVVQMMASGVISTRGGGVYQELDIRFDSFSAAMAERGIHIEFSEHTEDTSVNAGA